MNEYKNENPNEKDKETKINVFSVEEFLGEDQPPIGFDDYKEDLNKPNVKKKIKWQSEVREKDYERKCNKNIIMNKELQQIDYKDPLSVIPYLYKQNEYSISLFQLELNELNDNNLNEDDSIKLMEKREHLELLNKIIKNYLNYIANGNFERLIKRCDKLHLIEKSNREATKIINNTRERMNKAKKHVLLTSAKIALLHSKLNNIKKIKQILINEIQIIYIKVKNLKLKNFTYIKFYKENLTLQNNILNISNDYPNVKIIQMLVEKLKKKNEKFFKKFKEDFENIFEEKKENFYDLYCLVSPKSSTDNPISSFIDKAQLKFKKKSKYIILHTFHSFSEDSKVVSIETVKKISDIPNLKFEETKFLEAFKQTILKLKDLSEIYIFYWENKEKTGWAIRLSQEFKNKRTAFFTIIDKHLSKLLENVNFILRQFSSKRNTLMILNYSCLFEELLKAKMQVSNSKYFTLASKNLVLDLIKYENVENIKKAGVLLSGDIWEKTELEENFE